MRRMVFFIGKIKDLQLYLKTLLNAEDAGAH